MDDVVNRLSRELATAMAAAVADDQRVEACHEKARASGYDMKVSLEAVIGFASRLDEKRLAPAAVRAEGDTSSDASAANENQAESSGVRRATAEVMSSNDRRFLRSLRIAADETPRAEGFASTTTPGGRDRSSLPVARFLVPRA